MRAFVVTALLLAVACSDGAAPRPDPARPTAVPASVDPLRLQADMDGDGRQDTVTIADRGVRFGVRAAMTTLGTQVDYIDRISRTDQPELTGVADVNGDGREEVAVLVRRDGSMSLYALAALDRDTLSLGEGPVLWAGEQDGTRGWGCAGRRVYTTVSQTGFGVITYFRLSRGRLLQVRSESKLWERDQPPPEPFGAKISCGSIGLRADTRPSVTPAPPPVSAPASTPPSTPAAAGARDGDVDGDGRPDEVTLAEEGPRSGRWRYGVRVALSSGGEQTLWAASVDRAADGPRVLGVVDVDLDGVGEVFLHTGTAHELDHAHLAALVRGRLTWVVDGGDRADLLSGVVMDGDDVYGWGCAERDRFRTGRELYRTLLRSNGTTTAAQVTYYALKGARLEEVGLDRARWPRDAPPDPAYPTGIACGSLRG